MSEVDLSFTVVANLAEHIVAGALAFCPIIQCLNPTVNCALETQNGANQFLLKKFAIKGKSWAGGRMGTGSGRAGPGGAGVGGSASKIMKDES
jgi:hypothetical protein